MTPFSSLFKKRKQETTITKQEERLHKISETPHDPQKWLADYFSQKDLVLSKNEADQCLMILDDDDNGDNASDVKKVKDNELDRIDLTKDVKKENHIDLSRSRNELLKKNQEIACFKKSQGTEKEILNEKIFQDSSKKHQILETESFQKYSLKNDSNNNNNNNNSIKESPRPMFKTPFTPHTSSNLVKRPLTTIARKRPLTCTPWVQPKSTVSKQLSSTAQLILNTLQEPSSTVGSVACSFCFVANPKNGKECISCGKSVVRGVVWTCHGCGNVNGNSNEPCLKCHVRYGEKKEEKKEEKWKCSSCLVSNKPEATKCVCCEEPKKGSMNNEPMQVENTLLPFVPPFAVAPKPNSFPAFVPPSFVPFVPPVAINPPTMIAVSSEKWKCSSCLVSNKPEATKCVCCEEPKPVEAVKSTKSTPVPCNVSSEKWKCSSCLVSNKPEATKCVCCEEPKPVEAVKSTKSTPVPCNVSSEKWKCSSCLVSNKPEATKCVCCEEPKPVTTSTIPTEPKISSALPVPCDESLVPIEFAPATGIFDDSLFKQEYSNVGELLTFEF